MEAGDVDRDPSEHVSVKETLLGHQFNRLLEDVEFIFKSLDDISSGFTTPAFKCVSSVVLVRLQNSDGILFALYR